MPPDADHGRVTIAGRFAGRARRVDDPDLAGPELLPVRLARACARTLQVDGAGLSLVDAAQQRVPLGASSEVAEIAERLQFTVGAGPCMAAQETRQPVFAVEDDLRRRWPVFTDLLFGATPYRAVVALPLQPALAGAGAIDLYFRDSDDVLDLDVFEAMAVGELVSSALSDASVWSSWSPADGPGVAAGAGAPAPGRGLGGAWASSASTSRSAPRPRSTCCARAPTAAGRTVDDVAADLLAGRLRAVDLRPRRRLSAQAANGRSVDPGAAPAPPAPRGRARPRPGCRRARTPTRPA